MKGLPNNLSQTTTIYMSTKIYCYHDVAKRVTVIGEANFDEGIVRVAASCCSKNDPFSRKKGHLIASGRLKKRKFAGSYPIVEKTYDSKTFIADVAPIVELVRKNKRPNPHAKMRKLVEK